LLSLTTSAHQQDISDILRCGCSARTKSDRACEIFSWKPKKTFEDLKKSIQSEIKALYHLDQRSHGNECFNTNFNCSSFCCRKLGSHGTSRNHLKHLQTFSARMYVIAAKRSWPIWGDRAFQEKQFPPLLT
jgi:hypothetical protein